MAAVAIVYQNGIGGTAGPSIVTEAPFWALKAVASGTVFYVSSTTGTDAAAPAGFRREAPLATLAQAHTNAVAGDTIVLLSSHAESLGVAQTFNKANITVVSEGLGSARARFTCTAVINMFDVTAVGVQFVNISFAASTAAATSRIRTAASGTLIEDCSFDCGASDTARAILYINGANYAQVRGTTFTATAAGALGSITVDAGATMSGLFLQDVTIDGGSFGWTSTSFSNNGALTGVKALRVNQLNNSDVYLGVQPTGYWIPGVCTGSAYILQD